MTEDKSLLTNGLYHRHDFAHVLNIPVEQDARTHSAVRLFGTEFLSVRLIGGGEVLELPRGVALHMMRETIRMASTGYSVETEWDVDLFIYAPFSNPADDDEIDTLNSELLVTEEYTAPDVCG